MLQEIPRRLAELLAVPAVRVSVQHEQAAKRGARERPDLLVSAGGFKFAIEWKASGHAADVAMAAHSLRRYAGHAKEKVIPLLAVPYMGEVVRRLCEDAQVSWLDLSGNAHVVGPSLRVNVEGKPNQFKGPGRPRNVFAPKSARVARWLLMKSDHAFTQRELAKASGLDEGFTSRIVRQLEEQRLVTRDAHGAVRVADYDAMLDAWREAYDFSKHHIVRGHVAARSSDEVVRQLAGELKRNKIVHAATGLAGAWLLNQFTGFRLVVFYVGRVPSAEAQRRMGFHEEQRGENVWFVVPNDGGVFHGAAEREGICCVHPVQAYLDLKNHPERSAEATEQLRAKLLKKGVHA
jgi:ribosomal protein S28E/S33